MAPRRKERIAYNESRFRAIVAALEAGLPPAEDVDGDLTGLVCECGDTTCAALVHVPRGTYESVRANPRRFVVRPGHATTAPTDVVERGRRFAVVEAADDPQPAL